MSSTRGFWLQSFQIAGVGAVLLQVRIGVQFQRAREAGWVERRVAWQHARDALLRANHVMQQQIESVPRREREVARLRHENASLRQANRQLEAEMALKASSQPTGSRTAARDSARPGHKRPPRPSARHRHPRGEPAR